GFALSHFERTHFCWLPPDRLVILQNRLSVLILSFSTNSPAIVLSFLRQRRIPRRHFSNTVIFMLSWTDRSLMIAFSLRLGGKKPIPSFLAWDGWRTVNGFPSLSTVPVWRRSPNSARTISSFPSPRSPVIPRISPSLSVKLTPFTRLPTVRSLTSSKTLPISRSS